MIFSDYFTFSTNLELELTSIWLSANVSLSGFDVRKLSKMSNKSVSWCPPFSRDDVVVVEGCCFLVRTTLIVSTALETVVATFSSLPPLDTAMVVLGKLLATTSSSNAVSIVCLSTWIWLLWDPFVFIFNLRGVETKEDGIVGVLEN